MTILNKVKDFMLGTDIENEEEYLNDYDETTNTEPRLNIWDKVQRREHTRDVETPTRQQRRPAPKIVNFTGVNNDINVRMNVEIFKPTVVEDAASVSNQLKQNVICVINLEGVEKTNAQRIADFLGGSCYALDGEIQRVSQEIFIIAPANVSVSSEFKEELKNGGIQFPWKQTMAR